MRNHINLYNSFTSYIPRGTKDASASRTSAGHYPDGRESHPGRTGLSNKNRTLEKPSSKDAVPNIQAHTHLSRSLRQDNVQRQKDHLHRSKQPQTQSPNRVKYPRPIDHLFLYPKILSYSSCDNMSNIIGHTPNPSTFKIV